MSRPLVIDAFMWNDEADVLECRLDTMGDAVDWFVLVEADVDHQDNPKPYRFSEHSERFARWADKLIVVQASGLPHTPHDEDPWAREWAQRDWVWHGLARIPDLTSTDVVLHGDVDEICRPELVRTVRPGPREFVAFGQSLHAFAVDWMHPDPWGGTVAVTVETAALIGPRQVDSQGRVWHPGPWQIVRNQRNGLIESNFEHLGDGWTWRGIPDAGWHFSWLGGTDAARRKLTSFCHPEINDRVRVGIDRDIYVTEGFHVDGVRQKPVEVDRTWPPYVYERRCPASWWRPRTLPAPTTRSPLAAMYADRCATPSDIYEHLPLFVSAALNLNAEHVIELGTRSGVSTVAWLHGLEQTGGRLTSIDLDPAPAIGQWPHWTHIQADDLGHVLSTLDKADIVFIDTSHHYRHTLGELWAYRRLVRPGGLLMLHDTELAWPEGAPVEDGPYPVRRAIEEFVAETGYRWTNLPHCWGLGVIEVAA